MSLSPFGVARSLLAVAACSFLAACYNAAVYLPPELAPAPRLAIQGRRGWQAGERLMFGEYATVRRHRAGAAARFVADMVGASVEEPIDFILRARDHDLWTVRCNSVDRPHEPGVWSLGQRLSCTVRPAGSDSAGAWRLTMETVPHEIPSGALAGPTARFAVVASLQNNEGQVLTSSRPLGYYVRDGRRAVAALEVLGRGAAWLDPELPSAQRDIIAAALAALIIWDALLP